MGENMIVNHYCNYCDEAVDISIKEKSIKMNIKGIEFSFIGKIPYCNECNNEVCVSEINDENVKEANEQYREKLDIMKVDEINGLLDKHNIGEKPLAKLLGLRLSMKKAQQRFLCK